MNDTMQWIVFWSLLAESYTVYRMVIYFCKCAQIRTKRTQLRHLKRFLASSLPKTMAMGIFRWLPKSTSNTNPKLVMTDHYSKLTQAVPPSKTKATRVKSIFYKHWTMSHGILVCLLTDSGPQFVSKFFKSICNLLGMTLLNTRMHQVQTDFQAKLHNRAVVVRLRI